VDFASLDVTTSGRLSATNNNFAITLDAQNMCSSVGETATLGKTCFAEFMLKFEFD